MSEAGRPAPDLTILETRVYRGANVWSYEKAIHLVVDLGGLEQFPSNTIPGFTDNLLAALPGPAELSLIRSSVCRVTVEGGRCGWAIRSVSSSAAARPRP